MRTANLRFRSEMVELEQGPAEVAQIYGRALKALTLSLLNGSMTCQRTKRNDYTPGVCQN